MMMLNISVIHKGQERVKLKFFDDVSSRCKF
jgi:hypothetical protein